MIDIDCTWDVAPPPAIVHRARPRVVHPRAHFIHRAPKPVEWVINCAPEEEAAPAEIVVTPVPQYSVPEAPPTFEDGAQPGEDEPEERGHGGPPEGGYPTVVFSGPSYGFAPPVPEPGTWALFAAGLGLLFMRRRKS